MTTFPFAGVPIPMITAPAPCNAKIALKASFSLTEIWSILRFFVESAETVAGVNAIIIRSPIAPIPNSFIVLFFIFFTSFFPNYVIPDTAQNVL
jgi:hypothetical protein